MKTVTSLLIIISIVFLYTSTLFAEENPNPEPNQNPNPNPIVRSYNIEIVLDASGSMTDKIDERTKIDITKNLLIELIDRIPTDQNIKVGLRVYGHQSPKTKHDCKDSKLEVPIAPLDKDTLKNTVNALTPQGYTPIAYSLEQTLLDFPAGGNEFNIIILMTDGLESCGGDPCKVAEKLRTSELNITAHVIGFQLGEGKKDTLLCIPHITGGFFYDASTQLDLDAALKEALNAALNSGFLFIETKGIIDHCKIYDQTSGALVKECYSKISVSLLPGAYKIEIPTEPPTIVENVMIRKGERNTLRPGNKGYLKIVTDDFISNCKIYNQDTGELVKQCYSKTQIELPVGTYKIEIPMNPPEVQEHVIVEEKKVTEIKLQQSGKLYLKSRGIIPSCKITNVSDPTITKTVYSNTAVALPVGLYRIEVPGDPPRYFNNVKVEAGKTQVIDLK